jgi:HAD superfamily hydrolase (TIGR01509 family)
MSAARVRAVLFDLDGVLADSFEAWLGAMNAAAARLGVAPIGRPDLERAFGQGLEADAATFFGGVDVEVLRRAYDEAMPDHVARMGVHPQARDVLASLRARGIRTAVVTNTQASLAAAALAACGLAGTVDAVCALAPPLREKPHPDLLLRALSRLAVRPADAVMLGDSAYDEEAARAAGVRFVHYAMRDDPGLAAAVEAALR